MCFLTSRQLSHVLASFREISRELEERWPLRWLIGPSRLGSARSALNYRPMSKRAIITIKTLLHLLCLAPFAWLLHLFTSNSLANSADPINYITHFTGDCTLNLLFLTLAITPTPRLSPSLPPPLASP